MNDNKLLSVIAGNRDVIEVLEYALNEAREGRLQGIVLCGVQGDSQGWTWAHRDDMRYPWARLVTSVTVAQSELVQHGLD